MKLEVGMYVRYKRVSMGYYIEPVDKIGKIINRVNESDIYELDNNNNIFENDVVKASYNIIDILEVGDYVNGLKVIDIVENDIYISDYYAESYIGIVKVKDIKSIVTREQMEQMSYRIGE